MRTQLRLTPSHALLLVLATLSFSLLRAENPATAPETRNPWLDRHNYLVDLCQRQSDAKLAFVGDSITQNWNSRGRDVWLERYSDIKALNLGISGDRTENILWRLQNGELEGTNPELIVVLAGTNNIHRDSAEEIAEGVEAIVNEILDICPQSDVLLMGVFPRSSNPQAMERVKIRKINTIIAEMSENPRVEFLDISEQLLQPDGTMDRKLFPDSLHPLADGYVIWADAVAPYLDARLNDE